MICAGLVALAVTLSAQPAEERPPLDLPALMAASAAPGFTQLPDQPGRLGRLDAAAAVAVLDRSGQTPPERLLEAGFRQGHAKAWSNQDAQEVVLDVLLEFHDDRAAATFAARVVEGRRELKRFDVPGLPGVQGFERGPATPVATDPGQREVVLQHGRVVAIVVAAGHVAYPHEATLGVVAAAQWGSMQTVPAMASPSDGRDPQARRLAVPALVLLLFVGRRAAALLSPRAR